MANPRITPSMPNNQRLTGEAACTAGLESNVLLEDPSYDQEVASLLASLDKIGANIPTYWEEATVPDSQLSKDGKVELSVKMAKARLRESKVQANIYREDGESKVLFHVPSDFYDRGDCRLYDIIVRVCTRLNITIEDDMPVLPLRDISSDEEDILTGILIGLDDWVNPFKKISIHERCPLEIGRNICNWERRLAYCRIRGIPEESLHRIPRYSGDVRGQRKALTTALLGTVKSYPGRELNEPWRISVANIEVLLKTYFQYALRKAVNVHGFLAPVEIFKSFNETWNMCSLRRSTLTTRHHPSKYGKKGHTETVEKVEFKHPRKPSNLVGIVDTERSLVRTLYEGAWKQVEDLARDWSRLLTTTLWTTLYGRLRVLAELEIRAYHVCRRIATTRTKMRFYSIPTRAEFAAWYSQLSAAKSQGAIVPLGIFSPCELVTEQAIKAIAPDYNPFKPTFTNACKGRFDFIPGFKVAWEGYIRHFGLHAQSEAARTRPDDDPVDLGQPDVETTNRFEALRADNISDPDEPNIDRSGPTATKAGSYPKQPSVKQKPPSLKQTKPEFLTRIWPSSKGKPPSTGRPKKPKKLRK